MVRLMDLMSWKKVQVKIYFNHETAQKTKHFQYAHRESQIEEIVQIIWGEGQNTSCRCSLIDCKGLFGIYIDWPFWHIIWVFDWFSFSHHMIAFIKVEGIFLSEKESIYDFLLSCTWTSIICMCLVNYLSNSMII